jgi:hypothetical protein
VNNKIALLAEGVVCFGNKTKLFAPILAGFALLGTGTGSVAQVASDQAANYTLGWTNGANAGTGFSPWTFNNIQGTGAAGVFIGDPSSGEISGMATQSFGFFANPIGSGANAEVSRNFEAALQNGQTFSFQWGLNWDSDSATSNRGFNLRAGGEQLLNINMGNSSTITINGSPMFSQFGAQAFTLNFEQISPTSLRVFGTGRNGSEVYDNTFIGLAGAADGFSFYFNATEANADQRQMYFNNLSIVPEPAVSSLLLVGLAGLVYSARRKFRGAASR